MIIGVCGKSGSGKSTLSQMLAKQKNGIYVDIDTIGHDVLAMMEVRLELINAFGKGIMCDTYIDRKKLGELVFNSRKNMTKLSDITWKHMQVMLDKIIEESKDKIIILDWILLSETKYFKLCDLKILLDIPYDIRKARAMLRDNICEEKFALRDKASIPYDQSQFDIVITSLDLEDIKRMVKTI